MAGRDSQDLELLIKRPDSAARESQDLELIVQRISSTAKVSSDITLYIMPSPAPATALLSMVYADYQRKPRRNSVMSFTVDSLIPIVSRRQPNVFVVT